MDELKPRSWSERLLSPFAKVEKGETANVLLMTLTVFLILASYYVLKTAREGLILSSGGQITIFGKVLKGAELKSYSNGAMAVLLIGVVPAYGLLANKVPRIKLINISYAVVLASLVVFFVLGTAGANVGLAFFIWLGLVNVFLIAQFWSFANDIYTEDQGKRLFAIIAIGGSLGAIVGPKLTTLAGTFTMMLVAAGILFACIVLFNVINTRLKSSAGTTKQMAAHKENDKPIGGKGGFELLFKDRYLMLIAAMLFVSNVVNTTGEFLLSTAVTDYAKTVGSSPEAQEAAVKAFYADFFFWVNLVGFLIQSFLVSRIIKYFGVRAALFVMPIIAFGAYGAIALIGGLTITRIGKVAENATDYSLQNTVRQALWLRTSRAAKYKAKAAIDTFVVRFGDTFSAIVIGFGLHALSLSVRDIALINIGLVAVWLVIVVGIVRKHKQLEDAHAEAGAEA